MHKPLAVLCAVLIVACTSNDPASPIAEAGAQGAATPRSAAVATAKAPLPPGVVRLQPGQIMDPGGFERPVVAQVGLVPAGWNAQGGYTWNTNDPCAPSDYGLNWTLTAPDGVSAVAFVTKPKWKLIQWNQPFPRSGREPCENGSWTSVKEYLEFLAQQQSPQARVLDYGDRPDLVKQMMAQLQQMPDAGNGLVQMQMGVQAGQILLATTFNGRETREMIRATLLVVNTRVMSVMNPGQVGMITREYSPLAVIYARAPAGQLNIGLPDAIEKSLRPTPDWSNRVFQVQMKKQQARFDAMVRQGQLSHQALLQANAAHQASMASMEQSRVARDRMYDQKNLLSDRMQRENIELIRGVETYAEPVDGGVVQLDNTYDHAWRVRDGTYLLTNDPNFRPGLVGLEGQELKKVE